MGIVVLLAWVVGRSTHGTQASLAQPAGPSAPEAIEVLRQRFARGEITVDEFTAAKQVLEAYQ